ncbi:MAG: hypothetical protein LUD17_12835 [Bacteroidales bacterium]|nr:hypothetical protein [Bacteroidales bacterium]
MEKGELKMENGKQMGVKPRMVMRPRKRNRAETSPAPRAYRREERSPKLRRLTEGPMPWALRWGMPLLALALLALFAAVMMMPFPYGAGETVLAHWLG